MSCAGSLFRLTRRSCCPNCGKYFPPPLPRGPRGTAPIHEPAKGSVEERRKRGALRK